MIDTLDDRRDRASKILIETATGNGRRSVN